MATCCTWVARTTEVKVRGQRVELGEIEHHLRECIPKHATDGSRGDLCREGGNGNTDTGSLLTTE